MSFIIALLLSVQTYEPTTFQITANQEAFNNAESQCLDIAGLDDADHLDLADCIYQFQAKENE